MTEILQVNKLVKHYGALKATNDLSLTLIEGELHGVIGPNGAGKTTFIHQLTGEVLPDRGQIVFDGMDITRETVDARALLGIGRSYQITSIFKDFSVLENVMLAVQARLGSSFRFWSPVRSDKALYEPAFQALHEVDLAQSAHRRAGSLGYGEMRQLEIAMTLGMRPRVLLLDEPMAGMSKQESARLVELLQRLKGDYSIVLVEHDMDAVFALADRISVLLYGSAIACGTPRQIQENPEVRNAYLGDDDEF